MHEKFHIHESPEKFLTLELEAQQILTEQMKWKVGKFPLNSDLKRERDATDADKSNMNRLLLNLSRLVVARCL
jgi:hypothetical protein